MPKNLSSIVLFVLAGAFAIGLVTFAVIHEREPSVYDDFAQCLTDQGSQMYGAWWCSHCNDQKGLFGKAFDKINYVECSLPGQKSFSQECLDKGIGKTGTPTWFFADGTLLSGTQPLQKLADKTGCILPDLTAVSSASN